MKSYIITGILLFSFVFTDAQSHEYKAAMKAALKIHDDADNVTKEIQSLEAFEQIMKDHPNEWLANYWAAYLCTQIARLKGRLDDFPEDLDPVELIERSQKYFDRAKELSNDKGDERLSDLHMLQGFIYNWFEWIVSKTDEEKKSYEELADKEFKTAMKYNHSNPLNYVLIGTDLVRSDEYKNIVAGIALMKYAHEIYKNAPERSMTTYWNRDFIGFWTNWAEKKLEEKLQ